LKRTFTQKVKYVPTCAADSFDPPEKPCEGKQSVGAVIPTEVNRRARTSAAMIGLAISMGATGLLLPQQGDEAMAIEPVAAKPNLPTFPVEPGTSIAPAQAGSLGVVTLPTTSMPLKPTATEDLKPTTSVVKHKVQEGETLWELARDYDVKPEAIAASNNIQPNAILPVGQKLKIPSVNGIVHEVKAGETVEKLSESYGVEPTQLQSAPVTESGVLPAGEPVTVPGDVNDLLKARQSDALKHLKAQRDRLNDSLDQLRSQQPTNQPELATESKSVSPETSAATPVTLPPGVLQTEEQVGKAPKSVVIPVPTPEIAVSPAVIPQTGKPSESSVVIPVPTPEIAVSPAVIPQTGKPSESSVVIPVPTPEIATSPVVIPQVPTAPKQGLGTVATPEPATKPQGPQPVVMQPLVSGATANLYQVKPGDTLDAIARRHGLSRAELIQANGLNNPNLISVNQQLRIPQSQPVGIANPTVPLLSHSQSGQKPPGIAAPTLVIPTLPEQVAPVVPTEPLSKPQLVPSTALAQSTVVGSATPTPTVVVDTKSSQYPESQPNPFIEKLRTDILRLRAEYRHPGDTAQRITPRNIAVPVVTTPVASSLNNAYTPPRINPEFNPNRYNQSLQAELELRQQQQPTQQAAIQIEVPPPPATASSGRLPGLVAAAPAPAESYNPAVRTPVGQTVSPELPSPSQMYQPGSPAQFNGYIWPTKGVITSGYGMRWGRMHKGIDIAAPIGTPVVAAAPGVVVSAGWNSGGYGNLVEIQHPDGSLTVYAHNNRILVRRGQEVAQGEQISEMGSTGRSTGPHCHFEVHPPGRGAVNPIAFLLRQ